MAENISASLKRLDELEGLIETLFLQIEYIGELPIRREQFLQLKRDLYNVHDVMGLTKTTRMLRSRWPHIFVTYLSFTAAYNTNFGFWDSVKDDLGLTHKTVVYSEKNHWGKMYLKLIDEFGLNDFSDLKSGHKYVTPIRLQGGIPHYSLPDFFEYVVLPTVEKPELSVLNDRTALEEIQEKSEVKYRVDQVVRLYLEHGGEYAADFFSRTRKLARIIVQDDGVIPPADELELRPFVVQLFEDYLEGRVEPDSRRRVFSPRLVFWPHQAVFHLVLPEQTIPEGYAYRTHEWRIRLYENQEIQDEDQFSVRVFRRGDEIHTESKEVDIEYPYQQAVVEFGSYLRPDERKPDNGKFKVLRRWPIRLVPDSELLPVKSFDQQGGVIKQAEGLPPDYAWLMIPADYSLSIEGEATRVEKQADYWGPWTAWKSELWDLSDARLVELFDPAGKSTGILPVLQPLPVPYLEDEYRPDYSRPIGNIPLYVGKPPSVIIPLDQESGKESSFSESEEWSLKLESVGPARPEAEGRFRLSEFKTEFVFKEDSVRLPLSAVLGEQSSGYYQLEINRPDGKILEETFRIWPDLKVTGWEPLFLPESGRYGSIDLEFSLPSWSILETRGQLSDQEAPVRIELNPGDQDRMDYSVSIPQAYSSGEFFLVDESADDPVRVPLEICLPRLQWTVKLDDTSVQEVVWHSMLQDIPLAKVTQAGQSVMYVTSDLARGSRVELDLHLTLPESGRVLQTLSNRVITDGEPRCGFDLRNFLDTIRAERTEPFFDLLLEVYVPESGGRAQISVLRITRALDVREVALEEVSESRRRLHWREPDPLQHRRVQIWSIWQPWRDPVEIRLPDDAPESSIHGRGWFMIDLPRKAGKLVSGSYAFRFVALPPWEEKPLPEYPPDEDTLYYRSGDPRERLKWISNVLQGQSNRTFALHYERACILTDLGRKEERDQEITWLSSHSEKASISLLMKFYYWLEGQDPFTQKALRIRMYQPIWLKRLFLEYDDDEILKRYLNPIKEMGNIHPESARMILEHTDFPDLISRAVRRLVYAEDDFVVGYLLHKLEDGRTTALDVFEILKPRAEFALFALMDHPDSPGRSRLLKELAEHTENPLIAFCGWWIRTDAGWGRIEKIYGESGEAQDYYRIDKETPTLEVILRPDQHPLPVIVDLKEKKIDFNEVDCLYLCSHNSSCFHFISDQRNDIIEKHNRTAHEGLQPSFRIIRKPTIALRKIPVYSTFAPEDSYQ